MSCSFWQFLETNNQYTNLIVTLTRTLSLPTQGFTSVPHFINEFSFTIQIRRKCRFALIEIYQSDWEAFVKWFPTPS